MSVPAAASLISEDARAAHGMLDEQEIIAEQRLEEQEFASKRQLDDAAPERADDSVEHAEPPLSAGSKPYFSFGRRRGSMDAGRRRRQKTRHGNAYWFHVSINLLLIASWYLFSSLLQLYNKWMFSPDHYNFVYPLFVTSFHMVVQFGLAALVLVLVPRLRPHERPEPKDYLLKAGPCGGATGLDIGLSNLSLKTITLSFYTMCKSSSLGFVLIFAFLFHIERPTWRLVGIIALITVGVVLMVSAETKFSLVGMILVLTASAMSGLRWSITQILLDKQAMGFTNPIATLFWLAPIMAVTLGISSLIFEGPGQVFGNAEFFGSFGLAMETMALVLMPGVLAFCMTSTEFTLISRTSVVTLSIAGIFKEVLTIFISTVVFHDELTPINISGLCVTIFGIALYNYLKFREYDPQTPQTAQQNGHAFATVPHHTEERDIEADMSLSDRKGDRVSLYNMGADSSLFVSDQHAYELSRDGGQHAIGSDESDEEAGRPLDAEDDGDDGHDESHIRLLPRRSAEAHQIEHLDQVLQEDPGLRELATKQKKLERVLDKPTGQTDGDEEWTLFGDEEAK